MYWNVSEAPSGTWIVYSPAALVLAPIVVPVTNTVAPISGSPLWSVTLPVTV